MACYKPLALCVCFLLSYATWVSATDYTVGDTSGWTTGVDYSRWVSDKTFAVGDTLIFNYASGTHTVTEVSGSDYNSCSTSNAISNSNKGPTTISLTSPGTHYFICGVPGHCSAGMKLHVVIGSSSSGTPNSPSSSSTNDNNNSGSVRVAGIGPILMVLVGLVVLKLGPF